MRRRGHGVQASAPPASTPARASPQRSPDGCTSRTSVSSRATTSSWPWRSWRTAQRWDSIP